MELHLSFDIQRLTTGILRHTAGNGLTISILHYDLCQFSLNSGTTLLLFLKASHSIGGGGGGGEGGGQRKRGNF